MENSFLFFLPTSVCLVFGALLLLKRARGASSRIMGAAMLVYACVLNMRAGYREAPAETLVWLNLVFGFIVLGSVALTVAYFCVLTRNRLTRAEWWLILLPPAGITALIAALYAGAGWQTAADYLAVVYRNAAIVLPDTTGLRWLRLVDYSLFNYLLLAYAVWGAVHIRRLLRAYDRRLREYYAVVENKGGRESYFALWTLLSMIVVAMGIALFAGASKKVPPFTEGLLHAAYAVSLFLTGRSVLNLNHTAADLDARQRRTVFEAWAPDAGSAPAAAPFTSSPEELDARLQALLSGGNACGIPIWKDPELTLDKLAVRLRTDREGLTALFRAHYGMPFADYLDTLRITAAERMLSDSGAEHPLEWIAAQAGFPSMTSFVRAFKRLQGVTPAAWRQLRRKKR